MDYSNLLLAAVGVVTLVLLVGLMIGRKCPACKEDCAMERTGATAAGREEWKCTRCGHREWRDQPAE
ncbi:MAG: hypothetical protein ACYC35_07095 [Pirellulales bacterium]|jgi:transposase-like protein